MPALVPVDYDPFFDVAQQGPPDPNALVRLGPGGVTPAAAPNALHGALEAAYGLTGIPDLQAAYAAAARGEPLPALGQGAAGAAALIPALKPLAAAPFLAAAIKASKIPTGPIANALGRSENALLPAGNEVNRAVNALTGAEAEMPKFYRGTNPDDTRRITTGDPFWDSLLFASKNVDDAKMYGSNITTYTPNDSAKILEEGSKEFRQLAKGVPNNLNLLDFSSEVAKRAKEAGWDAVAFQRQGDVGTAILNPNAFTTSGDPIRAYHGSPYDFDAFDASKIGTGEGAQAYGHGLYFAEHPETAKNYKESTLYNVGMRDPAAYAVAQRLQESGGDRQIALAGIKKEIEDLDKYMEGYKPSSALEMREALSKNKAWRQNIDQQIKLLNQDNAHLPDPAGRMYEVNINADPDTFLHWDKPLSQQPEGVKQALRKLPWAEEYLKSDNLTGGQIIPSTPDGAEQMRAAGINGIKYLDQGSRNKTLPKAEISPKNGWEETGGGDDFTMFANDKFPDQSIYVHNNGRVEHHDFTKQADDSTPRFAKNFNENDLAQYLKTTFGDNVPEIVSTGNKDPELTHNYVVFSPDIIKIVKKYGLAPLIAGGAFATGGDANAATHLVPIDHDPFSTTEEP